MKMNKKSLFFIAALIVLQTACKLLFAENFEWSGFSPFIAIALFSGFIIKDRKFTFLLPLLALLISDAIIHILYVNGQFGFPGFYTGQWKNYLFLLLPTVIGWILKGKNYQRIILGAILAPTVFFLISNFNVWIGTSEIAYPKTFDGLLACYTAGLPFYKNEIVATLLFLPVIAVMYNYIFKQKVQIALA